MKKTVLLTMILLTAIKPQDLRAGQQLDEIQQYEIRNYDPKATGLNDLVFEARIENLTEILNKNLSIGKLSDVHYKIYWISPTQYQVEVEGLNKGFKEIKDELANLIKGKLEFILPEKFSEKFKNYVLKSEPLADGKLIRAIDETYTLAVSEVDIRFEKNGELKSIETRAPMSKVTTEFYQSPKAWSNNKNVLDKTVTLTTQGRTKMTVENLIEYKTVQGVGFPSKIIIKNKSVTTIPATEKEKQKELTQESSSNIAFSKYEINSGKAHKYILDGK
jgi:hypothetical protein